MIGIKQRPLWPKADPSTFSDWQELADDLILFLDQQKLKQIVGVGHSLGAVVSVFAARKRPDLFRRLILLEPVLFPQYYQWLFKFTTIPQRQKIIPVSKIANSRRDKWPNKEILFDSYRKKRIFKDLSDIVIKDWIDHGTVDTPQGHLRLTFPKIWESRIYATVPYVIDDLLKLGMPVHILRGEHTNVISPKVWKRLKKKIPAANLWELKNASHLAPLEFPNEVAEWILEAIKIK